MKNQKILFPFLFVICLILIYKCQLLPSNESSKIPGSFKALELFSYIRAYPNDDIPNDAYSKGYEHHVKNIKKASVEKKDNEWEAMGPLNTAGRTLTIAVNPQDESTIYAGSASGGLWRSRSLGLGQSWEYINTGFPVLGVSSIEFAKGDSLLMFIGTGEVYNFSNTGTDGAFRSTRGSYGIGILKSSDGGNTWKKSLDWSYNQQHGIWMIKVAPSDHSIVYAATTEGIYKSTDTGESWSRVFDVIMATDIDIDPQDPDKVVACFGNFGSTGRGIYYTTNGGQDWNQSTGDIDYSFQGKILIDRAPSSPNVLYASVGNGFGFSDGATWLLRSDDGGQTWVERNTLDYSQWQGWFSHDISVNPNDHNEIICTGIHIYKSLDGGLSLSKMTNGGVQIGAPKIEEPDGPPNYSHSDHHFVTHHPTIEDLILFGNDGGVFLSFDGGENFRSANGGYQSTQFYNGFSVSHSDADFALGGLQDNSTVIYRGTGEWQRAIGGDGSWTGINQLNDSIIYGSAQNLYLAQSRDRGNTFNIINIPFSVGEAPLFISPYVVSQTDPNFLYAGGIYVYKSSNGGTIWGATNLGAPLNGDPVFAMDVFDQNHQTVYAATVGITNRSKVFVTTNGGDSWFSNPGGLPNRVPNDIEIDPGNPSVAYVCFSGFNSNHLFKTEDFGQNWEAIGLDLPDVPGNAIAVDPDNTRIIYYGNDIGVYVSDDGGSNWIALDDGLPPAVIAMDLKVSPSDRKLWVATHGNGSYRIDMIEGSVATSDLKEEFKLFLYPNPSSDFIRIETENPNDIKDWVIYSASGQRIKNGSSLGINISDLIAGNYYINIRSASFSQTKAFVKI